MTIADYNNNPGNLKPPKGVTYDGQIGVDDRGFAIFENKEFGRKALMGDIRIKIKRGIVTPENFVDVYSPEGSENAEDARNNYKIFIADKLGLKNTRDKFGEDAADKLADAITHFERGAPPDEQTDVVQKPTVDFDQEKIAPSTSSGIEIDPSAEETIRQGLGALGASAGLKTTATLEAGKKFAPLLPGVLKTVVGQAADVNSPMTRMSLQRYLNSQIAPSLKLSLTELEKVAGGQKIRTMSEVQNALSAIQAVEERKVAKPLVKMVPGRPGVFEETGKVTTSTTPGRPGVDLSKYEMKPGSPLANAVRREMGTAGEVAKTVAPSVGRIGVGALGGLTAATQGFDAYQLAKALGKKSPDEITTEDMLRLGAKGLSAVGGGLSVLPFGVTQGLGLAAQIPQTGFDLYDWYKKSASQGLGDATANVDAMGNTLGVSP